jgi:hypothetical protein
MAQVIEPFLSECDALEKQISKQQQNQKQWQEKNEETH